MTANNDEDQRFDSAGTQTILLFPTALEELELIGGL